MLQIDAMAYDWKWLFLYREGEWWIGTGMATAVRVNMVTDAEARVRLTPEGRAVVESDMTDIGTGTYSILGQIAAEGLGLAVGDVDVSLGDTDLPPGSGGAFWAASTGTAVWLACEELRREIASRMGCDAADLTLSDGHATCGNDWRPLVELLDGEAISGHGTLAPGDALEKVRQATWGAVFSEVAVNDITGEVRVRRMHGTFAVGRVLNQRTARSQAQGGMTWSLGLALTEGMVHHGATATSSTATWPSITCRSTPTCRTWMCICWRSPTPGPVRPPPRASANWEFAVRARRSSTPSTTRAASGSATFPPRRTASWRC